MAPREPARDLVGLSREELGAVLAELGEPGFRANQLWHWIYHRGERDFERMTTLAKSLRAKLAEQFVVGRPLPSKDLTSILSGHDSRRVRAAAKRPTIQSQRSVEWLTRVVQSLKALGDYEAAK